MTEDLDDLMCPHSAAGRPERFPAKACIFAGECGCVYGAEWSRALRLADDAGEDGWNVQRLRGQLAARLGFTSVEMRDEHGTSWLCLPGCDIAVAEAADA